MKNDETNRKAKIIKLPITKGDSGWFGLTKGQLIFSVIGVVVALLTIVFTWGKWSMDATMTVSFIEISLILCFGIVRIQGIPLLIYLLMDLKGDDTYYYCSNGLYNEKQMTEKEKKNQVKNQSIFVKDDEGETKMAKQKQNNLFAKKMSMPKTTQSLIPFIEAYDNDLFLVAENKYSLIFEFENIDYNLLRDDEKESKITSYQSILNGLPTSVAYQEFIMNIAENSKNLEKALYPEVIDTQLKQDFVNVQKKFISRSENGSAGKKLYIALSYELINQSDTPNILFKVYRELQNKLKSIGSDTKILKPTEVFELLYNYYHPFDTTPFMLPKNVYERGGNIKDYIAPSIMDFKADGKQIQMGTAWTRILYVQSFERELTDSFVSDLLDNNFKICVSKFSTHIDKGEAIKRINRAYSDNEERIQKRNKDNKQSGEDFIPFELKRKRNEFQNALNALEKANTELFEVGVFISVSAETKEKLNDICTTIKARAWQHQIKIDVLVKQQNKGMKTLLPFGINYFSVADGNNINTYLMTDATSVLLPFSSRTFFAPSGICYGTNRTTGEPIVLDRTEEMNSNGFVLGNSGSGKSMQSKIEDASVLMKYTKDEVIVIDPMGEYSSVLEALDGEKIMIAPNSPTRINIFDIDLNYTENGIDAISLKSQFLMSIIETAKGAALEANEKSLIDRCIKNSYMDYVKSRNEEDIPTFTTFYELLKKQPEQEAQNIAVSLELYVTGSFNSFSSKSNITFNKRFTVVDTSQMGEQLSSIGLQIILEMIWQRVKDNSAKGIRTWVKVDEFSTLFTDSEGRSTTKSGQFFKEVYQRIRKLGGVVTAITQNITEVLSSRQAEIMLNNAEFVILLQQKKGDLDKLIDIFSLSHTQANYLTTGEKGTGLIICGRKIVPFDITIPRESMMYHMCSTNFAEKQEELLTH